jgi:nitric oxide reductase NorE protein
MTITDLPGTTDPAAPRVPGEPGIWFVTFGDLLAFGALFLTFMYYRAEAPATFAAGQEAMNRDIGIVNTIVLLTGSLAVAQGVHAYRAGARRVADRAVTAAILCASVFLVLKSVEWAQKLAAGMAPTTDIYFLLYYTFTGIHFFHVVVGTVILVYMRSLTRRAIPDTRDTQVIESGGVFWHLVDLLWVAMFALFYLVHS